MIQASEFETINFKLAAQHERDRRRVAAGEIAPSDLMAVGQNITDEIKMVLPSVDYSRLKKDYGDQSP